MPFHEPRPSAKATAAKRRARCDALFAARKERITRRTRLIIQRAEQRYYKALRDLEKETLPVFFPVVEIGAGGQRILSERGGPPKISPQEFHQRSLELAERRDDTIRDAKDRLAEDLEKIESSHERCIDRVEAYERAHGIT